MLFSHAITDEGVDAARFALAPAPADVTVRRLLYEGRGVADLEGVDLAAHFRVGEVGWLLITDFDCPFDEAVRVHLLDDNFALLDTLRLGQPYTPGELGNIRRTGPTSVAFSFPDAQHVREVSVEPRQTGWLRRTTRWLRITDAPSPRLGGLTR